MKISRDTMMVVCSFLETKELLKKITPLCKKLHNDVADSIHIRSGRKCTIYLDKLRTILEEEENIEVRYHILHTILKKMLDIHEEV